jgi:molybdopterin-guanine dinucleotide biosynthesis protein A
MVAMTPVPQITAFILAGGKSTRMGTDKAFVKFNGKTLLLRALEIARGVTGDVRIVGSPEKFSKYGPVVEDIFRDCGPLGGIHAALRGSPTELNLMLAVDMPFISASFLNYLVLQARATPELVVIPVTGGRFQPLCAVYRREFGSAAETALQTGHNRIDALFKMVLTRLIGEDELFRAGFSSALFRNLNSPRELQQAREQGPAAEPDGYTMNNS